MGTFGIRHLMHFHEGSQRHYTFSERSHTDKQENETF